MPRLIDADKLIEVFAEKKEVWRGNGVLPSNESLMWLAAMDITSNAPTIDAAPVVHGRWEPLKNLEGMFSCSLCGDEWGSAAKKVPMRYCPSCGAKMDLEED